MWPVGVFNNLIGSQKTVSISARDLGHVVPGVTLPGLYKTKVMASKKSWFHVQRFFRAPQNWDTNSVVLITVCTKIVHCVCFRLPFSVGDGPC